MNLDQYKIKIRHLAILIGAMLFLQVLSRAGGLNWLTVISRPLMQLQTISQSAFMPLKNNLEILNNIGNLQVENEALRLDNAKLYAQLNRLNSEYQLDSAQTRQSQFTGQYSVVPVKVIHASGVSKGDKIIDKGKSDGIQIGDTLVIDSHYLGQIIEVNDHRSVVQTMQSGEHKIVVNSSSATSVKGIVLIDNASLVMNDVLQDELLSVGQLLLTTSNSLRVPSGLIVAKVKEVVEQPTEVTKFAFVETIVDVNKVDSAFVIINYLQ